MQDVLKSSCAIILMNLIPLCEQRSVNSLSQNVSRKATFLFISENCKFKKPAITGELLKGVPSNVRLMWEIFL